MKKYRILFKYIMKLLLKLRVNYILNFFKNVSQVTAKNVSQVTTRIITLQIISLKRSAAGIFPGLLLLLILALTAILVLFSGSAPVQAHELLIEGVTEGKVSASFDDGTPAIQVDILVYHEGELQYEGRTDRQGALELPEGMEWDKIEARDNYGHRALYTEEEEDTFRLPRWAGALIGLSFLLLLAAFSGYRQK